MFILALVVNREMVIWQQQSCKILLLISFLSFADQSYSAVFVETGDDLVSYLCGDKQLQEDDVIELKSAVEYNISVIRTCVVNSKQSLILKGEEGDRKPVVSCIDQNMNGNQTSTFAVAFVNMSIEISGVTFDHCGSLLSNFGRGFVSSINSSSLYFSESHSSVFIFANANVTFKDVEIRYYYGFAFIGINLKSSNFNKTTVTESVGVQLESRNQPSTGSGVLLLFTKSSLVPEITIMNSNFTFNFDLILNTSIEYEKCVVHHFNCFTQSCPIINAAALTIIFNNDVKGDNPLVSIRNSSFIHNTGSYCSGVMIIMLNSSNGAVTISENTLFKSNNNYYKCPGSAIVFYAVGLKWSGTISPLIVADTKFTQQDGVIDAAFNKILKLTSTVFIGVSHSNVNYSLLFERVTFTKNTGKKFGSCLSAAIFDKKTVAKDAQVAIILRSITTAHCNRHTEKTLLMTGGGIFAFADIDKVIIDGLPDQPSQFSHNNGSLIYARNTPIYLAGVLKFSANRARQGAVLALRDSLLYFNEGLSFTAERNQAETFGGVIHSISTSSYTFEHPNCALQFPSDNIKTQFLDNSAVYSGSSVFAYPLYTCYNRKNGSFIDFHAYYERYLNITEPNTSTVNTISTLAYTYNHCNLSQCGHSSASDNKCHFPGQTINLCVNATGYSKGSSVYSAVQLTLIKKTDNDYQQSYSRIVNEEEKIQYIFEKKGNNRTCSCIDVTVAYNDTIVNNTIPGNESLHVALSSSSASTLFKLNFTHGLICPRGFMFKKTSGTCECSEGVEKFYHAVHYTEFGKCDINYLHISRPSFVASPWLGYIKRHQTFGITDLCPFDFCNTNLDMKYLKYDTEHDKFLFSNGNNVDDLCRMHREDTLCGKCKTNYSVVFGSGECMQCSNWWLFSILFYAVIGPMLIFVLYTLNLTITAGTMNGIIFYGQAANVGILPFLSYFPSSKFSKFIYFFLSLLNVNLGFSMCFYNGMNELWKTGLSLIFPIYLLAIVFGIILLSKYSTSVSNRTSSSSIQVLVTVIHLSVSKLLVTIIEVFTPIGVYTDKSDNETINVWYRNGSIDFYSPPLYTLMTFTVLIVTTVLLPYFTLLIGGRWLLRSPIISKYFRAIYEAIHGPYKENRRFWFLARQVLLIIMYFVYSVYRGIALHIIVVITLSTLILFLVLQEFLKPFKNKMIGIIDSLVMLNLITVYVVAWHQATRLNAPNLKVLYILVAILVCKIVVMFLIVLSYHMITLCRIKIPSFRFYNNNRSDNEESTLLLSNTSQASFYQSCTKYREPVIDYD